MLLLRFLAVVTFLLQYFVDAGEIALFPTGGIYSHDVMMREVGEQFDDGDNVTWIQNFIYDFGFGAPQLPDNWRKHINNRIDLEGIARNLGQRVLREEGAVLWQTSIPLDAEKLWDMRGTATMAKLLERHQRHCMDLLSSSTMQHLIKENKFELVVIDNLLQECMEVAVSLLNTTTVRFSNWPVCDGYLESLNLPMPPAYVPRTGSPLPPNMKFFDRMKNSLHMTITLVAKHTFAALVNVDFHRRGFHQADLYSVEASHLFFGTRSEMLFEPIRPINNRIKKLQRQAHPETSIEANRNADWHGYINEPAHARYEDRESCLIHGNFSASSPISRTNCWSKSPRKRHLLMEKATLKLGKQFKSVKSWSEIGGANIENVTSKMQSRYPNIDFQRLESEPFLLVSFGSVAQVENMPVSLFNSFLDAFARVPYIVVWQTSSETNRLPKTTKKVGENLMLTAWAPLKQLLAHRNLRFFISHGGINTINELLQLGVPVLGIPTQGDQISNVRRLVDLEIAHSISVDQVRQGGLLAAIRHADTHRDRYARNSRKMGSMLDAHRRFSFGAQKFWLDWAKRHGKRVKDRNYFHLFYRPMAAHFAVKEILTFVSTLLVILWVLS